MTVPVLAEKRCCTCGETKPLSQFHRNRSKRDGLAERCKPCSITSVLAAQAKRRAEIGDDAWRALRREQVRRHRANGGAAKDRLQVAAYTAAERRVREAHRTEFDQYLREERYARGLDVA